MGTFAELLAGFDALSLPWQLAILAGLSACILLMFRVVQHPGDIGSGGEARASRRLEIREG